MTTFEETEAQKNAPQTFSPAARALTDAQRTFCHEYLLDFSPKLAYLRAYRTKSERGAKASATRLMQKPEISAYIAELVERRNARTDVDSDRVVLELARIGFSDIRKLMAWGETVEAAVDEDDPDSEQTIEVNGVRWFPSDEIDTDIAAAISEVTETVSEHQNSKGDTTIRRTRKMKLHPKLTALTKLAEHVGVGKEAGMPGGMEVNVTVNGVTAEQQQGELEQLFHDVDNFREKVEVDDDGELVDAPDPSGKK